jgi:hypothetical protein
LGNRNRDARRNGPHRNVEHFHLCRLKECAMDPLMTGNGSRLAGPVHPDDVDPVSIVGEELCQRDHIVTIPASFVRFHHGLNRLFVRRAYQRSAAFHVNLPQNFQDPCVLS